MFTYFFECYILIPFVILVVVSREMDEAKIEPVEIIELSSDEDMKDVKVHHKPKTKAKVKVLRKDDK